MQWSLKAYQELTIEELFDCLHLRQSVFVVEQACPYPDIDATDKVAHHFLGYLENEQGEKELVACARLIPAGVTYEFPSIGRIATSLSHRGLGLGRELMTHCIEHMQRLYPEQSIKIGAQERLEAFYQSFGFETTSAMYLEDNIPHIDMILPATSQ